MKSGSHSMCCALVAASLCLPLAGAHAADFEPLVPVQDTAYKGSLTLYGWYTFFDGDIGIGNRTIDVGEGSGDLFDILDGFFMAKGDYRFGDFGVYGDLIYVDLSNDYTRTLVTYGWGFEGTIFTGTVTYQLIDGQNGWLQAVAGARYWGLEADVSIAGTGGVLDGTASRSRDWVDFVGGVRGKYDLSSAMFLEGTALAGGGGSEFMWDIYGGLGYNLTENFSASLGYRGMGLDYKSGSAVIDVIMHGPVAGLTLRF